MTTGKATALAIGVGIGALALGVLAGPHVRDRVDGREGAAPAAHVEEPAAPAVTKTAPARSRRAAEPKVEASVPVTAPELHTRLKPVLNRGTKMDVAADGFASAEQFAMVAHAARNTGVPFMVLKHKVLEEKQDLAKAIEEYKPDVDAAAEVKRAREAAREDVSAISI